MKKVILYDAVGIKNFSFKKAVFADLCQSVAGGGGGGGGGGPEN